MPWDAKDAEKHAGHPLSEKGRRQWAHVANSVLERTGEEDRAIAAANEIVKRRRDISFNDEAA